MKERKGTDTLTDETDADRKAEMPEDSRKGRGGTSPDTGRERQASAAVEETSRPETTMLLEEVLRRENLVKGIPQGASKQGGAGSRRHDRRRPEALSQGTLAAYQGRTPRGNVHSPAGQAGGYTEARRKRGPFSRDTRSFLTALSSRQSCRCSPPSSIPTSANQAMASDRAEAPTMRC